MPLPRYGVAIGTLKSFTRDPVHDFGRWYHGHVTIDTDGGAWESALDVAAPEAVGVAYRLVQELTLADLGPVGSLASGYHALASNATSGALDYVRAEALRDNQVVRTLRRLVAPSPPPGWTPPPPDVGLPGGADPRGLDPAPFGPDAVDAILARLAPVTRLIPRQLIERTPGVRRRAAPWIDSNGDNALDALAPHLNAAARIYLFGDRYDKNRKGVHDVHMNQGDPFGSPWWGPNGIWQDGGVACQAADGGVVIWQVRFKTQRVPTDEHGHPI